MCVSEYIHFHDNTANLLSRKNRQKRNSHGIKSLIRVNNSITTSASSLAKGF